MWEPSLEQLLRKLSGQLASSSLKTWQFILYVSTGQSQKHEGIKVARWLYEWQAINLDLVVHLLSAPHLGKFFFQWLNNWTLCYEFSVEHFGCRVACDGKVVVIVTIVNVPAVMNRASSVSWPEWWVLVLAGVFRRRNASSLCSPRVAVMVELMPTSPNYISWGLIQSLLTNGGNRYQVEMWVRNIVINMIKRKKIDRLL